MTATLSEDKIFMLIKFSDVKEHLCDLQKGKLYMNNSGYFIEREKIDGKKGVGDEDELSQVLYNVNLKFYKRKTEVCVLEGEAGKVSIRFKELLNKPVFCLTHISAESLNIIKETDCCLDCQLNFDKKYIDEIVDNLGEYALIINPGAFQSKLKEAAQEQGIVFKEGRIQYEDYSVNPYKKLEECMRHNLNLFFYKDLSFQYQREYRIVINNVNSEKPFVWNIGDISDITYFIKTRDLFSDEYALNISKVSNLE